MNRRGFLLGAGALAAPSIIGISGVIQLSRPALVMFWPIDPGFVRLISTYAMSMSIGSDVLWLSEKGSMRLVGGSS